MGRGDDDAQQQGRADDMNGRRTYLGRKPAMPEAYAPKQKYSPHIAARYSTYRGNQKSGARCAASSSPKKAAATASCST